MMPLVFDDAFSDEDSVIFLEVPRDCHKIQPLDPLLHYHDTKRIVTLRRKGEISQIV